MSSRTAIQIRDDDDLVCRISIGNIEQYKSGEKGEICLVNDNEIVIYLISQRNKTKAYLFKTNSKEGDTKIVGVYPSVTLLVEAKTKGKVTKLLKVFDYMSSSGIDYNCVSEKFYVRLNSLLEGREITIRNIKELISHGF